MSNVVDRLLTVCEALNRSSTVDLKNMDKQSKSRFAARVMAEALQAIGVKILSASEDIGRDIPVQKEPKILADVGRNQGAAPRRTQYVRTVSTIQ